MLLPNRSVRTHVGKQNKEEATVSSEAEQNKTLVRRLFEARRRLDMDALDKMLAPHFLSHTTRGLPGQQLDREGYKRTTLEYHAAFSNTSFMFEEQVAEADKVVSRISGRANVLPDIRRVNVLRSKPPCR